MKSFSEKSVNIKDIDFNDTTFKISRMKGSDQLRKSVSRSGILYPPALLDANGSYKIISGFNRLSIAKDLGIKTTNALIYASINIESILLIARQKEYHNEIGPVGKTRLIDILLSLGKDRHVSALLLSKEFSIPDYIIDNSELREFILNLPVSLLEYIDEKSINYKMIYKLYDLPYAVLRKYQNGLSIFLCELIPSEISLI